MSEILPKPDFNTVTSANLKFRREVDDDLKRFGKRIVEKIEHAGRQCELNPPQLKQFDAWGNRVDLVETCREWNEMKDVSAEEGVISVGYERKYKEWRCVLVKPLSQ